MRKIISVIGSDKIVCRYFDNGYCRFEEKCKFLHPKEICNQQKCRNNRCDKRHPKPCRFFVKNKCKFGAKCKFKHDNDQTNNVSPKSGELKIKLQIADDVNANPKKEIAMKDSVINLYNLPSIHNLCYLTKSSLYFA